MIRFRFVLLAMLYPLVSCATQPGEPDLGEDAEVARPTQTAEVQPESPPNDADSIDEAVMYRVMSAEMRGNDGDMAGAVGDYLAAAMESTDPQIAMRATRVAFAAKAWQQASMAADRWAMLDPQNLSAHESAALAMLATADYAGAELHLLRIIELGPDKDAAWGMVADLLGRSASPEKAVKSLQSLLATEGEVNNAAATFAQSQLAFRLGDNDQAYGYAIEAIAIAPTQRNYLIWAGQLARQLGNNEDALEFIRKAWELEPRDHDITLAYADLLARNEQPEKARELMRNMEQTPDVYLSRILFELSAEDRTAALAIYEEFKLRDFENGYEKSFYLGQSADALQLYPEAIASFSNIKRGQYFLAAMARTAELQAQMGDIPAARKTLAILRQQPDDTVVEQAWLTEAQILQQAGQNEDALMVLDEALERFQQSISLRYSRALIAANEGNIDRAEADLLIVLSQDPENAAALNALGYTLADQTDRLDEAEDLISRAYELLPEDAAVVDSMGWVAFKQGRLEDAEKYLRMAMNLDDNPEIAAHLGEVLWVQGREDEARAIWNAALEITPDNAVLISTMERLQP